MLNNISEKPNNFEEELLENDEYILYAGYVIALDNIKEEIKKIIRILDFIDKISDPVGFKEALSNKLKEIVKERGV